MSEANSFENGSAPEVTSPGQNSRLFTSSTTFGKLAEALSKAQGVIEGAKKDSDNPFFHSRYADLASVWEACRGPLAANGLAVIQLPGHVAEGLFVDTILTHSSGEWISSRLFINPVKQDPQGIGSAITYGRRYGLQAMVGIAPEDDDGEAAMGRTKNQHDPNAIEERQRQREDAQEHAEHGRLDNPYSGELPAFTGDWETVVVPFGKDKGKTLGSLPKAKLKWYQNTWQPKPFRGTMNPQDLMFRSALNASIAPPAASKPPPEKIDETDEIPF